MRRTHTTNYPSYVSNYNNGSTDSVLESENDRLTDELKGKISSLKSLTIDIGSEVRSHNEFLSEMDDDIDGASGFIGKAMGRVKRLSKGTHNYITLYLLLFSLFIFLLIWIIIRF